MSCCVECFRDLHIRATIEKYGKVGLCDFCGSKDVAILDLSLSSNLVSDMITGLVQIYKVSDSAEAKPLKYALRDDWDIFTAGAETILDLTRKLCGTAYPDDADIFTRDVTIEQLSDVDYLRDCGIVRGSSWGDFSESIKYSNRFHSGMFNPDVFESYLRTISSTHPVGSEAFRARITSDRKGFTTHEMGAPPKGKRTGGRVNPDGVGVLYLSSDKITVLNEVRANAYDYISIGRFRAKRSIVVANLSGVGKSSPFLFSSELEQFAANRKVFQDIAAEIAKPLRRSDSPLEYLPTQYIAEFIKSKKYDGVEFASTLRQGGYNLAVFDESLFECVDVETVEVSEVLYTTEPLLSS